MVKIRLMRLGRKKRPFYRIVVQDARKKRNGEYLDQIGYYHPIEKKEKNQININKDKVIFWYNKGAQLTKTVNSIVKKNNIELSRK